MSNVLVAQVIVEKLSHLLQRHVTGVNVILAVDVGDAHEIFDTLESMMKFARTNGFLGDHVTRIPHCYTTSPVYDLTFQVQIVIKQISFRFLPQDSAGDLVAKLQLLFEYDAIGSVVAGKEIKCRVLV